MKAKTIAKSNKHLGGDFDEFLKDKGILEDCEAYAVKRVLAWQIEEIMKKDGVSKAGLARRMRTSRTCVDRLLDAKNPSVTLLTLDKAARALNKNLEFSLK
jgi:DNA-binding Xre family transcriptional regulator